jgi:DNA-binding NtrC family response regulator
MHAALEPGGGVSLMTRTVRDRATILVADDDPTVLRVTEAILVRAGYTVLTAPDGEMALKAFEEAQHTIQLVISDVLMPGMKGPQLVRSIKNLSPSTATLLMSATPPGSPGARAASILKPFTRGTLVAKVQEVLADCDFVRVEREQSNARSRRLAAMAALKSEAMRKDRSPLRDAVSGKD